MEYSEQITQDDIDSLPELSGVVLWQPDENAPSFVIDRNGMTWNVGLYDGIMSKTKVI